MAPWLILGFIIAGILHVLFPEGKINNLLGSSNLKSVFTAALLGVPLPLCSCGVIPTGISIHKNGASKGAAVSFLISTPQTGVDSIMVTYSLLGLPFAIIRPLIAFITGIAGGWITNKFEKNTLFFKSLNKKTTEISQTKKNHIVEIFRYAFINFLADIAKWLVIGLLIAALISVIVPDDFFSSKIKSDLLGMLILLAASVPLYVCATSSVPIAAVLLSKGLSPGAVLVFLMAGPATNAATISVIGNSMGRKTLISYLVTIISGALIFGFAIDTLLPRHWFDISIIHSTGHHHGLLPHWLKAVSGWLMMLAIANIFFSKLRKRYFQNTSNKTSMTDKNSITVKIKGMNCNHCKANVEKALSTFENIEDYTVDLVNEHAILKGVDINLKEVQEAIEDIGYKFEGLVS